MKRSPQRHQPVPSVPAVADPDGSDPFDLSALVAADAIDVIPGDPPVPITVWRVPGPGSPLWPGDSDGITAGTAPLLVGQHAHPGDTVVSVGYDRALAGCAGATGCTYLAVADVAGLAGLDHLAGRVRLLVLRWPPVGNLGNGGVPAPDLPDADLFAASRRLLTRDGCAAVAIAPPPAGRPYVAYARLHIQAARAAGLGWLQHIVVITATIDGDNLTAPAVPADRAMLRSARSIAAHIDLLVFVLRRGRRG